MGTHDELQAQAALLDAYTPQEREHAIATLLQRALGGLYEPARRAALQRIISATLAVGGEAAMVVFSHACLDAARLDAAGRVPERILSRPRARATRAREGAHDPERGEP